MFLLSCYWLLEGGKLIFLLYYLLLLYSVCIPFEGPVIAFFCSTDTSGDGAPIALCASCAMPHHSVIIFLQGAVLITLKFFYALQQIILKLALQNL